MVHLEVLCYKQEDVSWNNRFAISLQVWKPDGAWMGSLQFSRLYSLLGGRHRYLSVPLNCELSFHAFCTYRLHLPSVHLCFRSTFIAIQSTQRGPLVHQRCRHFFGELGELAVVGGDESRPGGRAGGGKSDQGGGNGTRQLKTRVAEIILPLNSVSSYGKG